MRKYIALFLALALACTAGLALAEADVVGHWYTDVDGLSVTLTLNSDGGYTLALPEALGQSSAGTWALEDGFVRMDDSAWLSLVNDSLLIWTEGATFFTREPVLWYTPAALLEDAPASLFAGYWKSAYVDLNGTAVPASAVEDKTDLYIEGHSGILGGPRFGDTQVKLTFADGALTCEHAGTQVTLQIQQDGFLRLTTAPDAAALYLFHAAAPDEALDEDLDDTP